MTHRQAVLFGLALTLAAGLVTACVELDRQRIVWFHDEARDELRVLLFYDGIHDSQSGKKGPEQVEEFVASGSVMFLDWFGHLDRAKAGRFLREPDGRNATDRMVAELYLTTQTEILGHYRDEAGRIGAVQRVTIPEVSTFVERVNRTIDLAVVDDDDQETATERRILAAARAGKHPWVALDGHAIRITIPVHPDEWQRWKVRGLEEIVRDLVHWSSGSSERSRRDWDGAMALATLLAAHPVSILDQGDTVVFSLGHRDRPTTWRADLRDGYEPNLEPVVISRGPADFSSELAVALLDGTDSAALADVSAFGPREVLVGALLDVIEGGDTPEPRRALARAALEDLAQRWNAAERLPEAPEGGEADTHAWKAWVQATLGTPWFTEVGPQTADDTQAR